MKKKLTLVKAVTFNNLTLELEKPVKIDSEKNNTAVGVILDVFSEEVKKLTNEEVSPYVKKFFDILSKEIEDAGNNYFDLEGILLEAFRKWMEQITGNKIPMICDTPPMGEEEPVAQTLHMPVN